jgi:hypothetical protein
MQNVNNSYNLSTQRYPNKKWPKDFNRHFSRNDIQMANSTLEKNLEATLKAKH